MEIARMPLPLPSSAGVTLKPRPRSRWWAELMLVLGVYAAYSVCRLMAQGGTSTAVENGLTILRVEKALFLNAEHPLNRLFTSTPAIGIPADFLYASLHYLVTPAVLVWFFLRRPEAFRAARTWLLLVTLLGLVGFVLVPTCPPRLLEAGHGFVDTMAQYSAYGWWGTDASAPRGMGALTNQYAAMPSLHVAWAVWSGLLLWRHARTPLVKWLGVIYPLVITVVVMGTANHYFLDAVAGVGVVVGGALLTGPVTRAADRIRTAATARLGTSRTPSTESATSSTTAPGTRSPAIVSGGCETSAGERFPGQRTRTSTTGTTSADDTPATAR
ncbi:phosphatase PAP2 family protein [Streptomyces sp. NPDC088116]|uniref:phosphatase PAP2 family protein n=1 Tax=Streptomyces sp. NPDC088116 TaxID=3365825 RepID=UPI00380C6BEE